MKPY